MPLTIEQQVSKKALEFVTQLRANPPETRKEYLNACQSLPALIRSSGLARALAFLRARTDVQKLLAGHIEAQFQNLGLLDSSSGLQSLLADSTLSQHRVHVRMAMLIALWHKRISQALLKEANP